MKQLLLPVLFSLLFWSSCSNEPKPEPRKNISTFGEAFTIEYKEDYKLIYIHSPKGSKTYILYRNEKPLIKTANSTFVKLPLKNVVCLSNIFVGSMAMLGETNRIIGVDNGDYICNEEVRKGLTEGRVKELAKNDVADEEQILITNPSAVFTFGDGSNSAAWQQRLNKAGIPVIISLDQFEKTPLSRASWLRFVAAFFDKEITADSILNVVSTHYDSLRYLAAKAQYRPKVLTEIRYNDTWFVPGGNSFMSQLIHDAGADYPWRNVLQEGSLALSYEDVFVKAAAADYWINLHHWKSKLDCLEQDERNSKFAAFQKNQMYNNDALNNGVGGNQYWETGLLRPDEVLKDLIFIFHPEVLPQHQLKYYRKLQ